MELQQFVDAFAEGLMTADAKSPVATHRSGKPFRPGIGPHSESETICLTLEALDPGRVPPPEFEAPYPAAPKQKCDLLLDETPGWAIEVKMLRMLGDNGKPNDNMLLHLLSPYPKHRSAVTDCKKLATSGFSQRKAIVIYGYESTDFPLADGISAFETLASRRAPLGHQCVATFDGLIHPVHKSGEVYSWEILSP